MTDEEIPTDAPLYRCVWKKSKSVTKYLAIQLGTAIVYAILLTLMLAVFVAVIMWVVMPVGILGVSVGGTIYGWLASIPEYIYIILAAVLAIPAYSTYWCIARNFSEEDQRHILKNEFTVMMGLVGILLFTIWGGLTGFNVGATITFVDRLHGQPGDYSVFFGFLFGVFGAATGGLIFATIGDLIDTYRYHRKRVAGTSFTNTVEEATEDLPK